MTGFSACNTLTAALVVTLAACVSAGEEAKPAGGESKVIALVAAGDIDAALVERVAGHIQEHMLTAPRVLPATAAAGADNLEAEAKALASLKADDVAVLICLLDAADKVENHGGVFRETGIGIINVTALSPGDPDAEKLGRRLEKESLRAAALLTGSQPCPLPLCALWHYKTLAQLDGKGRNLCMPCRATYLENSAAIGLVLIEAPAPAP